MATTKTPKQLARNLKRALSDLDMAKTEVAAVLSYNPSTQQAGELARAVNHAGEAEALIGKVREDWTGPTNLWEAFCFACKRTLTTRRVTQEEALEVAAAHNCKEAVARRC